MGLLDPNTSTRVHDGARRHKDQQQANNAECRHRHSVLLHAFHDASDKMISCLHTILGERQVRACKAHLAVLPESTCRCSPNSKIQVGCHLAASWHPVQGHQSSSKAAIQRKMLLGSAGPSCNACFQRPTATSSSARGPETQPQAGRAKLCFEISAPGLLRRGVGWSGPAGKRPRSRQTAGRAIVSWSACKCRARSHCRDSLARLSPSMTSGSLTHTHTHTPLDSHWEKASPRSAPAGPERQRVLQGLPPHALGRLGTATQRTHHQLQDTNWLSHWIS